MNKVDDKAKEALAKIMAEQAARAAKIEKLPPLLRQFYKRMGKAGRERALKMYDINAQIQQFITLYQELVRLYPKDVSDEP